MLRLLLIAILTLARLADAAPPSSIAATYEVRMNGLNVATVDESYRAEAGTYRLTSSSTPIGILAAVRRLAVRFTSNGTVTSHGLQPRHFEGRRATGEIPEVAAEFDWSAGELKLTHEGRNDTVALPPGAQDRLSVMYQFMFVAPKASDTIDVAVTNGRRLDTYAYSITRDVEQDTPLGRLKTLHLVKQRERGDPENEIWLSPEHGYLPVRMIIVERDGTRYEQVATKLELKSP